MNDSLSQLKEIKLPNAIGLFPLAYGWYIVFVLLLTAVLLVTYFLYRYRQRLKPIKKAMSELEKIKTAIPKQSRQKTAIELVTLIKRFLMYYYPRKTIAPLYGKSLAKKLNDEYWINTLIALSYEKEHEQASLDLIVESVEQWIKKGKHVSH